MIYREVFGQARKLMNHSSEIETNQHLDQKVRKYVEILKSLSQAQSLDSGKSHGLQD